MLKRISERIDPRALNRATLARQMLLERSSRTVVEVIEHLVGLQSQAPTPPYFGLWTRVEGFSAAELSDLLARRRVVRVALMRSTIHLVTARDCMRLRPLIQPVLDRAFKGGFSRLLGGAPPLEVVAAGRSLLETEALTFAELGVKLRERWPQSSVEALSHALRAHATLVQVPPRGLWGQSGRAAHTTAEHWLGLELEPGHGLETLVRRYLAAFGPASVRDIQMWSGLTRLAPVLAGMRSRLRVFHTESGVELFDVAKAPRPDAETPAPIRFLPEWDNLLISYADRTRVIEERHRAHIFTVNGIIAATVLVDGFVRATWAIRSERDVAILRVTPFEKLSKRDRDAVADEGARLMAFAAPDAVKRRVEFVPID
ncbi:MAG: winged helix DNA-binding domain-containing protein [Acidobacteriota bacterium]